MSDDTATAARTIESAMESGFMTFFLFVADF
jgi:hypothetical protein